MKLTFEYPNARMAAVRYEYSAPGKCVARCEVSVFTSVTGYQTLSVPVPCEDDLASLFRNGKPLKMTITLEEV